jgi:Rps23 Pro-64 3,4-dihydroxylase Tpa1-like proline 4-hydroxylase
MQIAAPVVAAADSLGQRFATADPFRHLVIDGFFESTFADALLREFPSFERGSAVTENGDLGLKSTVEQIRGLGPAYEALDDLLQSRGFLDWLSRATGIPNLLYDPYYFGGGTHESRSGQELDAHVDFNRHPANGWHRRLNLIVYLNPEWEDDWGGSLELHTDPREADNRVTLVTPLFNRCVVFETTECSWHGFSRIRLPAERPGLTRRSIALYFYSRKRPAEELAPEHSTIYVERPLPERYCPGVLLTEQDVQELKVLLTRRDQHIQRLYRDLMKDDIRAHSGANSRLPSLVRSLGTAALGSARFLGSRRDGSAKEQWRSALRPLATYLPASARPALRRLWQRLSGGQR